MARDLFFYGTLRHAPLLEVVMGRQPAVRPASLPDHRVASVTGQDFPIIVAGTGVAAEGILASGLSDAEAERLDFYEMGFHYTLQSREVLTADGPQMAEVFVPDPDAWEAGTDWDFRGWVDRWGALAVEAAREVMSYHGRFSADQAARIAGTIDMRAASRLRALVDGTPRRIRGDHSADAVTVAEARRPYVNYFALSEVDLAFPRFDGGMSETVTRAALLSADAVTVLPYDPVRDRVLVIEQFRFGAYERGDPHPWSLEPVAGRIDPGETPEETARREAVEEAGLELKALHPIASYYPSPGALTEYLYTFIGIADLPDGAVGLGGLESEAEDIKGHILSLDGLLELVTTGEADNGPLILSALWLAREKGRL